MACFQFSLVRFGSVPLQSLLLLGHHRALERRIKPIVRLVSSAVLLVFHAWFMGLDAWVTSEVWKYFYERPFSITREKKYTYFSIIASERNCRSSSSIGIVGLPSRFASSLYWWICWSTVWIWTFVLLNSLSIDDCSPEFMLTCVSVRKLWKD